MRQVLSGAEDKYFILDELYTLKDGDPIYKKGVFTGYHDESPHHHTIDDSHEAHAKAFRKSILTLPYFAQCGEAIWWHTLDVKHKCMCNIHKPPPPPQPPQAPQAELGFTVSFDAFYKCRPTPKKTYPPGKIGIYKGKPAVVGMPKFSFFIKQAKPRIYTVQECEYPHYYLGIHGTDFLFDKDTKYFIHTKDETILASNFDDFTPQKKRIANLQHIHAYLGHHKDAHVEHIHDNLKRPQTYPDDVFPRQLPITRKRRRNTQSKPTLLPCLKRKKIITLQEFKLKKGFF